MNPSCTLISAFYDFPKKKASNANYDIWIKNFLENTDAYMVLFTDSENTANYLANYRKSFQDKTKIYVENLESLYCYQYYDYWTKDLNRDHEKAYHNQNLYIIWNEKTMFMQKAFERNNFNTEFYAWIDIGMVRNPEYIKLLQSFPSSKRLQTLKKDKVYVMLINNFIPDEFSAKVPSETFRFKDRIGGGMILCSKEMIPKWTKEYYAMLAEFMQADLFAGKDQSIMANIFVKNNSDLIELVMARDLSVMDNIWFYMLYFLSDYYMYND
jgi:hypothetical protein